MSDLPPDLVGALAELNPISKDPIAYQAGRLVGAINRYEAAVVEHGIGSRQAAEAGESYDLVAKLYAPSLVGALARQILRKAGNAPP